VIEGSSTVGEDSTGVRRPSSGINGDGSGSSIDGCSESRDSGDEVVSSDGERVFGASGLSARVSTSGSRLIRIRSIGTDSVFGIIVNSVVFETSVTSSIDGGVTITKLLFRERSEGTGGDPFLGFDVSSGGESPARSTVSLVFNSLDGTSFDPVNISDDFNGGFIN